MKIKANEHLFREWQELADKIKACGIAIKSCSSVVQNDMVVDKSQVDGWAVRVRDLQCYLIDLKHNTELLLNETLEYVKNCNRPTPKVK